MKKSYFETILGCVILVIAIMWIGYVKHEVQTNKFQGYTLVAKFDKINGIQKGSDVRISGIKVGEVTSAVIDNNNYLAIVKFTVDKNIKLPSDTSIMVATNGFFGSKHLAVTPGGSDEFLSDGDEVIYTQGSINLESIIGKLLFSTGKKAK